MLHQLVELIQTLCCLREQVYRPVIIQLFGFRQMFDDHGGVVCLSLQTDNLGVSAFAEDSNLRLRVVVFVGIVGLGYSLLQTFDHGASAIDNRVAVLLCYPVGAGRLAVCAQQHACVVNGSQIIIIDRLQPQLLQPLHLLTVVHYITQAVELPRLLQLVLCATNGTCHSCAESAVAVNCYLHASLKMR